MGEETKVPKDLTRGMTMVGLSLAVSIDAFAVGFPIGFSGTSIPFAVTIIWVTCGLLTLLSMKLASRVSSTRVGTKAEFIAGLVLIGLSVKIWLQG
jgi:putative Mn2+ efflux pump MntP